MREGRDHPLAGEVGRLRAMIESQHRRIRFLEADGPPVPNPDPEIASQRSRRDLLRLAGAAVIGAAGAAAVMPDPVAAASGGGMVLGQSNLAESPTALNYDGLANGALTLGVNNSNSQPAAIGIAASGKGNLPDIKLTGTGRLSQAAPSGVNEAGPTSNAVLEDTIRGQYGDTWVNRPRDVGGWRRVNSFRLDNPNGDGHPFTPIRIVNTDPALGPTAGEITGPLHSGVTTYQTRVAGVNGIPDNALGVFGNVTAVAYTSGGFLTLFPFGETRPAVSSLNFSGSYFAWSNFFCAALGNVSHAAYQRLAVYAGLNSPSDTCHLVIDIFGYIE